MLPEYANLIKKSVFPSEVVPLTIFLSNLISHFLGLALLVVGTGLWVGKWSWTIIVIPALLVLLGMLTVGSPGSPPGCTYICATPRKWLTVLLTVWSG